ncbi:MAG: GntR family transcriptional regulator [Candidatus Dormibacteria bacterium]
MVVTVPTKEARDATSPAPRFRGDGTVRADHASFVIDRDGPVPLFVQLRGELARQIRGGSLPPGSRMPSEKELGDIYGISRITVRQALDELEHDGAVVRIPGKGTYAAQAPKITRVAQLAGFGENIRAMGRTPSYRTLAVEVCDPSVDVTARLALGPSDGVVRIDRLLLAETDPVALACSWLPTRLVGRMDWLTAEALDRSSLYELLARHAGVQLHTASEEVEPVTATALEANHLAISRGSLLLKVRRLTYDTLGKPFEDVTILYCPERYRFCLTLNREPLAP